MLHHPHFFGYGSLVNRATHDYSAAHRARARGWRRVWRRSRLRPVSFLSVEPADGAEIDGLIAAVPDGDWAALDRREAAYDRHAVTGHVLHAADGAPEIALYRLPDDGHEPAGSDHPILLSYVDVVVQGYLREFGRPGAERFFATTSGWDAPLLDDRAAPRYPRHQRLEPAERDLVDALLRMVGARTAGSG
ncbi:MAG: gamma-glutamylcyclotransferase [Paracoccaceae bacterium]